MRFIAEFVVEVIDPTTAASYTMDWAQDGDNIAMLPYPDVRSQMEAAVSQAFGSTFGTPEETGFRWVGGTVFARQRVGDVHPAVTLPEIPVLPED